jgi:hypothetical protein
VLLGQEPCVWDLVQRAETQWTERGRVCALPSCRFTRVQNVNFATKAMERALLANTDRGTLTFALPEALVGQKVS